MAKKKSATAVTSPKRSTKSTPAKSKNGRAQTGDIPAVETPDLPPAIEHGKSTAEVQAGFSTTDPDEGIVTFLQRRGYTINRATYARLSMEERNSIRRWMEDTIHSIPHTVPPCLLEFDTNGNTRIGNAVRPEDEAETFFVPMEFGRVSYEETGSVPVTIPKEMLTPEQAEELLCDSKIGVVIELRDNSEKNQPYLPGTPPKPRLSFVIDSKSYRSNKDGWNFTLKFGILKDQLDDLFEFAGRTGRAELTRLGSAESKPAGNGADRPHPDVEAGKDRPHGTPVLEAAAKVVKESKAPKLIPDDDPDELMVLPQTPNSRFMARVEPDGKKWKSGCDVRFVSGEFEEFENSFADEAKTSQTTLEYAVTAVVERWIGYLQKRENGDWKQPIADLQAYLSRLRSGVTPEQIDAELMAAGESDSPETAAASTQAATDQPAEGLKIADTDQDGESEADEDGSEVEHW